MIDRVTMLLSTLLLLASFAEPISAQDSVDEREVSVGMTGRIEQIKLPGSELVVIPREDDATPIVLRITGTFPHGTDTRYDLVYYGLDPGTYDLCDYLRRADGSSKDGLPRVEVKITPELPPGQVRPSALEPKRTPRLGGYRTLLVVAGVLWVGGLLAILFVGRKRRRGGDGEEEQPKTLADVLRPLVERAMSGDLPEGKAAQLERALLAYWRRRLGLEQIDAAAAIVALREHGEAGRLFEQLEIWLHRPGTDNDVDVAALLEPYRDLPADALELRDPGEPGRGEARQPSGSEAS